MTFEAPKPVFLRFAGRGLSRQRAGLALVLLLTACPAAEPPESPGAVGYVDESGETAGRSLPAAEAGAGVGTVGGIREDRLEDWVRVTLKLRLLQQRWEPAIDEAIARGDRERLEHLRRELDQAAARLLAGESAPPDEFAAIAEAVTSQPEVAARAEIIARRLTASLLQRLPEPGDATAPTEAAQPAHP